MHANETVCGKTKSPEESLFKNFKEQVTSKDSNGQEMSLVDVMWMQFSPKVWSDNLEFLRFEKLLNGIICVNDVAERNVKNICHYAEYSKNPERRDRAVMVANYHREFDDFSKMSKAELSNF